MSTQTCAALLCLLAFTAHAAPPQPAPGDAVLHDYFRSQVADISAHCLADVKTLDDWQSQRPEYRRQLLDMLGLWPLPEKTDLKPVITGAVDRPAYTVERLYFQSRPGLYVTGNLYVPKGLKEKAPAILYVCGHATIKKDGIAYGSKTSYQHHGEWFARNGYVCLIIDTLQLGEIEGIHHGLYRKKMWWWLSRGYTPEGVEAWNCIRAIDYLQSRAEVDPERIGMTGRSGGGAYTWYTAAIDERVKCAVPVAGMTDLENYVVDGCIEGHCDCMFMVNTYRWDFPLVAALIAPRPLLYSNSDKDRLFPLDGVERTHQKARDIYKLYKAEDKLGLLITEGPHKDTQDLQVPAFRWFNRWLKKDDTPLKDAVAEKELTAEQLKVFPPTELPKDQLNTKIQETFVPLAAQPKVPASKEQWSTMRDAWMKSLNERVFRGWPAQAPPTDLKPIASADWQALRLTIYEYTSQPGVRLRLYALAPRIGAISDRITMRVIDEELWPQWLAAMRASGFDKALASELAASPVEPSGKDPLSFVQENMLKPDGGITVWVAPRGIGLTAFTTDEKARTHILRRFELLGQTLDGMRVWDVRRAIATARQILAAPDAPVVLRGRGPIAVDALYASLFEANITRLDLIAIPTSHRDGPQLLNVLQVLDTPTAVALAAERCQVNITESSDYSSWLYSLQVRDALKWPDDRVNVDRKK